MAHVILQLEDPDASDFAPQVVDILNSALKPDSPTSPSEAAAAVDSLFDEDYAKTGAADTFLWWFWDLVHDLARQLPYNGPGQDRLVAVVKALQELPPKTLKMGENWGSETTIEGWTTLAMFGNLYYDKCDHSSDRRASGEAHAKERDVNLQAFAARVTGLGLVPFEMYAIWALVDALEGTMTPIRGAPDEVNEDPASVEDLSYKIKSAAAWMIHAGHRFYGRDEEVEGGTAGPLWKLDKKTANKLRRKCKGTDGLCPQRWQLWKERFGVIRDAEGLDAEIRKEAGDGYTAMDKIEKAQSS